MKNPLDEAKLLATLLGVLKKENSKVKDELLKELYSELQKDIEDQTGVKYLQLDEVENPVPIQVFKGEKGAQGPQGKRGLKGTKGDTGPQGERGPVGPQGERGLVGSMGIQGIQGPVGPQGPAGKDGKDGRDGDTPDVKPIEQKLTRLFDEFKGSVSAQVTRMAYARGGGSTGSGEVRLLRLDDVDTANLSDGKYLRYNANTGNLEFATVTGSGGVTSYNDLTDKPNLDQYLQVANASSVTPDQLTQYLQVANNKSIVAGNNVTVTQNATSIIISSTASGNGAASNTNLSGYLQVANSTNFVSTANTVGTGTSVVQSKINNIINFKSIKAGQNISLTESGGDIIIAATGTLSVSDALDFGFVSNDFGLITDSGDSDPQYDFGTI